MLKRSNSGKSYDQELCDQNEKLRQKLLSSQKEKIALLEEKLTSIQDEEDDDEYDHEELRKTVENKD